MNSVNVYHLEVVTKMHQYFYSQYDIDPVRLVPSKHPHCSDSTPIIGVALFQQEKRRQLPGTNNCSPYTTL